MRFIVFLRLLLFTVPLVIVALEVSVTKYFLCHVSDRISKSPIVSKLIQGQATRLNSVITRLAIFAEDNMSGIPGMETLASVMRDYQASLSEFLI